jgi:hypothetical protein
VRKQIRRYDVDNVINEQHDTPEDFDANTWTASGDMQNLPTKIFKGNVLQPAIRKTVLQSEPRNKDISFEPPIMDKKIWTNMPRNAKELDTTLRRVTYHFSSVIRPVDNTLRLVYASKPDDISGDQYEAWVQLEQTVLNTRALALDALSFVNELRQEQALKATISPNYHKPPDKEEVFGEELYQTIKMENESNKLLNDAAYQKKRSTQHFFRRNQQHNNINYKLPQKSSGSGGKWNKGNNSWKGKPQKSENSNQGGP